MRDIPQYLIGAIFGVDLLLFAQLFVPAELGLIDCGRGDGRLVVAHISFRNTAYNRNDFADLSVALREAVCKRMVRGT